MCASVSSGAVAAKMVVAAPCGHRFQEQRPDRPVERGAARHFRVLAEAGGDDARVEGDHGHPAAMRRLASALPNRMFASLRIPVGRHRSVGALLIGVGVQGGEQPLGLPARWARWRRSPRARSDRSGPSSARSGRNDPGGWCRAAAPGPARSGPAAWP